jgi:hypothetical protein
MPEAVGSALRAPFEYSNARCNLRDYVFEKLDGHCARRAADALRDLMQP